jgi:ketosteroid isomerase-like protein
MPQEAVELIRTAVEAWRRGDEAWAAPVAVEVEWENAAYPATGPRHGRGREAFLAFMNEYQATWRPYEATIEELVELSDTVLVVLRETVRRSGRGPLIERDTAQLWTVNDGRIVRYRVYRTKADAMEAA